MEIICAYNIRHMVDMITGLLLMDGKKKMIRFK